MLTLALLSRALLPRRSAFFGALSTVFAGALRFCWPVPGTGIRRLTLQMLAVQSLLIGG